MSEIIPKEKVLKSIRKGILIPAEKPFEDLDLDNSLYNQNLVSKEESIFEVFLRNEKAYFQTCANKFDFLSVLNKLMIYEGWSELVCNEASLTELLVDNGIATHVNTPTEKNPYITSCFKALSKPSILFFDNRYQYVKKILSAPILIILISEHQLNIYDEEKSVHQLNPLDNYTRCAIHPKMLSDKEVYFFLTKESF